MTDRKMLEAMRVGHLQIIDSIETRLEMQRTATLRKRHKELQGQMHIIKAWATGKGLTLPTE